jgi:hypothetical protein
MKQLVQTSLILLCLAGLMAGCGGGSSKNNNSTDGATDGTNTTPTPTVPKVGGNWSGAYYLMNNVPDDDPIPLTARIRQDGKSLFITTTKEGIGHSLTGTIDTSGDIRATDAFDGELWTTHFGPATANAIRLADFLYPDQLTEDSPFQIIDLHR